MTSAAVLERSTIPQLTHSSEFATDIGMLLIEGGFVALTSQNVKEKRVGFPFSAIYKDAAICCVKHSLEYECNALSLATIGAS